MIDELGYRTRKRSVCVIGAAVALTIASVQAHDFWIDPSDFRPTPGTTVTLRLLVGQNFEGDPVPRDPAQIVKFFTVSKGVEEPVSGVTGRDPAGFATPRVAGLMVVGYRSNPHPIELQAQKFEDYLVLEGLERIVAIRGARGEHGKNGKEQFSRCAKALLAVGNSAQGDFQKPIGLTLELIPEKNPYLLKRNGTLPLKLLYNGAGLGGALVVARNRARPEQKITARTDKGGRATLLLYKEGDWMIKAVHMIPAPAGSGADWESLWASLTFETGAKPRPDSLTGLEYVFVDTSPADRPIIENAIARTLPRIHLVQHADEAELVVRYSPARGSGTGAGQIIKADRNGGPLTAKTYAAPAGKDSPSGFATWFISAYTKDNS
ncbi:MAG TPA: DUF4198 domain-containing protein [Thermoanaerobaculia bacterium]|nr:DUF4198 domain-containing protein [Thermoanaerobaculia bacterium]